MTKITVNVEKSNEEKHYSEFELPFESMVWLQRSLDSMMNFCFSNLDNIDNKLGLEDEAIKVLFSFKDYVSIVLTHHITNPSNEKEPIIEIHFTNK